MTEEKKYKVLLIGPSSPHIANHYNRISDDIFTISIISNDNRHFPEGTKIFKVDFTLKSFACFFRTPKLIRKRILEFKPDVLHIHQANSVGYYTMRANKGLNIPTVLTAWGSDILLNPKESRLLKYMAKYILKRATVLTSDSKFMAEEMRALLPEKELDIELCNFGVPEVGVSLNKENIVYSNRSHNPLYRIQEVIRSYHRFQLLLPQSEKWELVIAGSGSQTDQLKKLVSELGLDSQTTFLGFIDQKANIAQYARARIFISLPESDATPMSLLEAMYFKCIPVLSDLPANREWVEDGKNGIIVSDLEENSIQRALNLDAETAGQINRQRILSDGTVAVSKAKFKEVLLRAINK